MSRGEIWLTTLDPTVGSEIRKTRPCLVVSPREMNVGLRTVLIAPLTTGYRPAPYRVAVTFNERTGLILLDQLRTVDRRRLLKLLGVATDAIVIDVLTALRDAFEP